MAAVQEAVFAEAAQTASTDAPTGATMVTVASASSLQSAKSYKLVKSPTGNNLFVEADQYDPLEHHRPRDKASNKGQGLGFMFCCFSSKTREEEVERFGYEEAAVQSTTEPAPSAEKVQA